jgi:hypothetical protein
LSDIITINEGDNTVLSITDVTETLVSILGADHILFLKLSGETLLELYELFELKVNASTKYQELQEQISILVGNSISEEDVLQITDVFLSKTDANTRFDEKQDKFVLTGNENKFLSVNEDATDIIFVDPALLGLKEDKLVEIPQSALDIPVSMGIPLYTLDTGGNYVLCEPDSWFDLGNGMCIPAYSKSKLQSI